MSTIEIPDVDPDADALTLALSLAEAGLYVLPTRSGEGDVAKHAGSVVGKGWPSKSSRDPEVIAAWFAGTDHRVAIHAGRSGLVIPDVDHPDRLTPDLERAIREARPPYQSTRPDEPGRGHHLFAQPEGRRIGNRAGGTGSTWGEWRGANGIILVGGPGRVLTGGPVPVLPDYVAALLPDVGDGATAVSDAEVYRFVREHVTGLKPRDLQAIVGAFAEAVEDGESRHNALVSALCWAVREAIECRFAARPAFRQLQDAFTAAMARGGFGDRSLTPDQAEREFLAVAGWAVAQEWTTGTEAEPAEGDAERVDRAAELQARARVNAVADRVEKLRVEDAARRAYRAETADPPAEVVTESLADVLAEDDTPVRYRVADVWPRDAKIVLAAQAKSGKTTLVGSLVRSLADAEPFLGRHAVEPLEPGGTVTVLDFEMNRGQFRSWTRALGIRNAHRVRVRLLRGQTWDPRDPDQRRAWAEYLRSVGTEVLIVDPLNAVLAGLGLDVKDGAAVGPLLFGIDALCRDAGIGEYLVVHHMGHNGERSAGASELRGWPDAEWFLVLEDWPGRDRGVLAPPDITRFFRAYGRDVEAPESALEFDAATRRLTIGGGTRATHAVDRHVADLTAEVEKDPGITVNGLKDVLSIREGAVGTVVKAAERAGLLHIHPGPSRSRRHYPGVASADCRLCLESGAAAVPESP